MQELTFYTNLYQKVVTELEAMIDPTKEPAAQTAREIADAYFATVNKPLVFQSTSGGYIIEQENSFEELCAVLEDNGTANPKGLTTYEFLARAAYCERKFKNKSPND